MWAPPKDLPVPEEVMLHWLGLGLATPTPNPNPNPNHATRRRSHPNPNPNHVTLTLTPTSHQVMLHCQSEAVLAVAPVPRKPAAVKAQPVPD